MGSYLVAIGCILVICTIVSILWVRGIDHMQKNHPDYKADDWLNWNNEDNEDDKDQIM